VKFIETLKLAVAAILAHKLRSALTLLGMIVGVTAFVVVVSLIEGFNRYVDEKIAGIGAKSFTVQRFNPLGGLMWQQTYNGSGNGNDLAADIRIATNGEVYVCGTYYKNTTDSNNAIVIKYDQYGNQRWTKVYNGTGSKNDAFTSMLVNGSSVVVTGSAFSSSHLYDMVTMRMDTAGSTVWTTTYDNVSLNDGGVSLSTRSGDIFVAGVSQSAITTFKIATWKIFRQSEFYQPDYYSRFYLFKFRHKSFM